MEPMYHKDNPQFRAVAFRRTMPNITNAGSMWDQSMRIYPLVQGRPNHGNHHWEFPSGARLEFASLQYNDSVLDWKSSELACILFDQLEEFTEYQFWYMYSRNRSTSGVQPYIRASVNPVPITDEIGGWIPKLMTWWIDQDTGYPIPERDGVVRWLVREEHSDEFLWFCTREQAATYLIGMGHAPDRAAIIPRSWTFIASSLEDNKKLLEADPGYYARLMALPLVERERLLKGNWKVVASAGNVFNRAWFELVEVAPIDTQWVRYWDKAGTSKDENPLACYSVGVKMGYSPTTKRFYVGDVQRGQWNEVERETRIKQAAQMDGSAITIYIEQEPGSGGKESARSTIFNLAGFACFADRVKGDKYVRAKPYIAMVQARNVSVVIGPWTEAYLAELHNYVPNGSGYMDQVDASSGAFNKLIGGKPMELVGVVEQTDEVVQTQRDEAAEAARQHVMNQGCVFPGEW